MAGSAIAPGLVERLLRLWHGEHTAAAYRDLLLRPDNPHLAAAVNERRRHDRQVLRLYDRQDEVAAERLASMQSLHLAADPVAVRTSYGLELLDPTAARRVVELCLRIPETYFLRKGERRAVARAMLRGRIPDRVVNERRKGEQGTNWRPGFELARNVMEAEIAAIDEGSELAALLDVPRMRHVMRSWPTDNWTDPAQVELYRYTLMRTIVVARFDRWLREGAVGAE
jgi:asparagine synthase (glutamine-hydrolysing)